MIYSVSVSGEIHDVESIDISTLILGGFIIDQNMNYAATIMYVLSDLTMSSLFTLL
jgi:hypothetical protein